jgi:hypothetical protein
MFNKWVIETIMPYYATFRKQTHCFVLSKQQEILATQSLWDLKHHPMIGIAH